MERSRRVILSVCIGGETSWLGYWANYLARHSGTLFHDKGGGRLLRPVVAPDHAWKNFPPFLPLHHHAFPVCCWRETSLGSLNQIIPNDRSSVLIRRFKWDVSRPFKSEFCVLFLSLLLSTRRLYTYVDTARTYVSIFALCQSIRLLHIVIHQVRML